MNLMTLLSSPLFLAVLILVVIVALLARHADGSPFVRLAVPTLLLQILYPDSRKVGYGWALFLLASYAAFVLKKASGEPLLDAEKWLLCVGASSALMGFGTAWDKKHQLELAKLNVAKGGPDAAAAASAAAPQA